MPRKNILAIAQRQALNIHLSIALMDRPIKIWEQVDELLQTLTGYPKIFDDVDFKPPPPPPPATRILNLLTKHNEGLTCYTIVKQTGLDPDTAQAAIDELLCTGEIARLQQRGWKKYTRVQ